ncbi:MAG: type II and III secretion system protein family protein [Planctomycetes bacterium]|nr:type II and III secretion system protein family protein [Planctomycetota bacterium]MCH9727718.1 type II and III secretion system protein family protein [Planctomycetota bacterium]MCH9776957.1 type II and III secretion system protein family protein [Planctomycetota bacterium]MCH9792537.1 type II and III secretion system protein family protein [Planctomycetota bacterium]
MLAFKKHLRINRFPLFVAMMCSLITAKGYSQAEQPVPAGASEPVVQVTADKMKLEITEKFSKILKFPGKIKRVDGFDPTVLGITALTPNEIRVQALVPGVTTLVITDENKKVHSIETFVSGDARHLQAYLKQLFPSSSVEAIKVQDSVVLRGWVTQPEAITEMVEIAEQFFPNGVLNQMKLAGVQQVLLKVKIMEVQRSKIRQLGVNWLFLNQSGYVYSTPGSLVPITGITVPFGGPPALTASQNLLSGTSLGFGLVDGSSIFQAFIDALKQEALLKILAEPELVTTSGRPANLLSGGEFPILVPQSLGTVTIEWREFGVRMEAVPIVLGNGRLRLEVQPEVSERDFSNAVQVAGTTVPGLTVRRANTAVEMNFGETMVIAGLISSRKTAETSKTPFLGELPFIGAAFRRVRYTEGETELVIMVTPELVSPLKSEQVPAGGPGLFTATPTDRELYSDGVLEVPSYGSDCPNCRYSIPGPISPESMIHSENVLPPSSASQIPQVPAAPTVRTELIKKPSLSPENIKALEAQQKIRQTAPKRPAGTKVPVLTSPATGQWKAKQNKTPTPPKKSVGGLGTPSKGRPGLISPES